MDSLTQIVLGAAVGEAVLGKKIGNKALLFGAIAGTIPDLDVFIGVFKETIAHRGFSHSFLFAFSIAPIMAYLMKKFLYKKDLTTFKEWTYLYFWGFVTHILLDVQTIYGTQLFWPLNYRPAIANVFVVDPLYTIPFLICVVAVMFYKRDDAMRRKINTFGLILSTSYLLLTGVFKMYTYQKFSNSLKQQNISYQRIETGPTPLNSILWFAMVEKENEYLYGQYSLFDKSDLINFKHFKKDKVLRAKLSNYQNFKKLKHFSKNWFLLSKQKKSITYSDIRFGSLDIEKENPNFVFQFQLNIEKEKLHFKQEHQRKKDDFNLMKLFSRLYERIKGI